MHRSRALAALSVAALAGLPRAAVAAPDDGPTVTVYSTADPAEFDPQRFVAEQRAGGGNQGVWGVPGFGVVKDVRRVELREGANELAFSDVAEFVDPTTVSFTDLTDPAGTSVLEQSFQFDLVSPSKLLEKYLDREIGYETTKDGQVVAKLTGKVLSVNEGLVVLQSAGGLRFVPAADPGLRLPALPEGLTSKPTLLWRLTAAKAGAHDVRTTYQTAGLTWRADYNVVLGADDTKADVGAWVSLLNLSGASWKGARLKLVAGDVNRVQPPVFVKQTEGIEDGAAGAAGFQEKPFFEYHLYTLPRRTDLLQNATQQITLFPTAVGVAVEKQFVFRGQADAAGWGAFGEPQTERDFGRVGNAKLDVWLRFRNTKENQLGVPLPKGKIRVSKLDPDDGGLEFIGEGLIAHTPKDEEVRVRLGQAFDLVGERTQTDFRVDAIRRTMTESFSIQLRNHKAAPVRVLVEENLYRWTTWDVVAKSDEFAKADSRTIRFDVTVPPDGSKSVTYTVQYAW